MTNLSLMDRLSLALWPTEQVLDVAIGVGHPARINAFSIQASTAIANLAICIGLLYTKLPGEIASRTARKLDETFIDSLKNDTSSYRVSDILLLESERNLWRAWSNADAAKSNSDCDTIYRVVFATRLGEYQNDFRKGWAKLISDRETAYGGVGFVAKRFLSHINGKPILNADSLFENGFEEMPLASFHFSNMVVALSEIIEQNKHG